MIDLSFEDKTDRSQTFTQPTTTTGRSRIAAIREMNQNVIKSEECENESSDDLLKPSPKSYRPLTCSPWGNTSTLDGTQYSGITDKLGILPQKVKQYEEIESIK